MPDIEKDPDQGPRDFPDKSRIASKRITEFEESNLKLRRKEELISQLSQLKKQLLKPLSLNEKLKIITDSVVDIFEADFARIWLVDQGDLCNKGCIHSDITEGPDICINRSSCLHLVAGSGRYTHLDGGHRRVPVGSYKIGRIAAGLDFKFITNDVTHDKRVHDRKWARKLGLVSFAGFKLSSEDGNPVGVLALFKKEPLDEDSELLLEDLANYTSQVILTGTAMKLLQESEKKYYNLFENAPVAMYRSRIDGSEVLDGNQKLAELFGYFKDDIVNKPSLIHWADPELRNIMITKLKDKGTVNEFEVPLITKDGVKITQTSAKIYPAEGYFEGTLIDITERREVENSLKQAYEEKKLLLKEIHHRVKNNLMVISSLLNLQSQFIKDVEALDVFKESQNRALSMALIHERLYESKDLKRINFGEYIKSLAYEIYRTYVTDPKKVKLQINVEDIMVDINTSVPLGLIVNELLSNSMKYAFPDDMEGIISIEFYKDEDEFQLIIDDNGVGFPQQLDYKKTDSLGLQLINNLTDQIDGSINLDVENGTRFTLRFQEKFN